MTDHKAIHLSLGLSGAHLLTLLSDQDLRHALATSNAAFVVAGIDRIDGSPPGPTIDPSIAVTALAELIPTAAFLAAAAPVRDHPYNLARRIGSLGHLTRGRTGVALGIDDSQAPAEPSGREAWGGAGLGVSASLGPDTTRDVAQVLTELWHSWPYESLVADTEARIFARGEQIVHIDHHNVFDIAGPLTLPASPHGTPVVAWYVRSKAEMRAAADSVDLVILAADFGGKLEQATAVLESTPSKRFGSPRRPLLFAEVPVTTTIDPADLISTWGADVDGLVLRPDTDSLTDTLDRLASWTAGSAVDVTLRERLDLPEIAPLSSDTRSAFSAPQAQPPLVS